MNAKTIAATQSSTPSCLQGLFNCFTISSQLTNNAHSVSYFLTDKSTNQIHSEGLTINQEEDQLRISCFFPQLFNRGLLKGSSSVFLLLMLHHAAKNFALEEPIVNVDAILGRFKSFYGRIQGLNMVLANAADGNAYNFSLVAIKGLLTPDFRYDKSVLRVLPKNS